MRRIWGLVTAMAWLPTAAQEAAKLPSFEVATIKPLDPQKGGVMGFLAYPSGRVIVGAANVTLLILFAFDVQQYQIAGGPDWARTERFNVEAMPPGAMAVDSSKMPAKMATPTKEQRLMLQSLLIERFGLKFHREMRDGSIYTLERGQGKLGMVPAKEPASDPRGTVVAKSTGYDGTAFGNNVSTEFIANKIFARFLMRPVVDRTGLTGTYDFELKADDPENTEPTTAVLDVASRLGLKLKVGKGMVETIVIDSVTKPSEN